jgi:hypothetical protein
MYFIIPFPSYGIIVLLVWDWWYEIESKAISDAFNCDWRMTLGCVSRQYIEGGDHFGCVIVPDLQKVALYHLRRACQD